MSDIIEGGLMTAFVFMLVVLSVVLGGIGIWTLYSRRPLEKRYGGSGRIVGGALSGMDAAFFPTSQEAGIERDRQTKRTAPAPAPGDPPWMIGDGRITLDVDMP
ncbi:hypothetical protein ACWGJP_11050 [Microbacterium sp. NPDC055903]